MEKLPFAEDHVPTFAQNGKFHVRLVEGTFQNIRRLISWPLLVLFFGLVWVQLDGQPLLLFSFEQRHIILFGNTLFWHDLKLLAGLMIAGAFLLFFMAVTAGRAWCGFSCPQSIWTWLFIRIENIAEGRSNVRKKNEQHALKGNRLLRRFAKHLLWILLATLTAFTFSGYFIPIRDIIADIVSLQLSVYTTGWLLVMTGLTYLNAGLMREKICLHACPYSRFQSAMFDRDTMTVSYDSLRGEPRSNRRNNKDQTSGDCVDCGICIQVCPAGIDIRDGLQAACIDCAACIDACDTVMEKLGSDKGLIRFASEAQLDGGETRLFRPQLVGYGAALVCALSATLYGFTDTTSLLVAVQRDRNSLFTQLDERTVCNNYQIKVEGVVEKSHLIQISLAENRQFELFGPSQIDLTESNSAWLPYRVCTQDLDLPRTPLTFNFTALDISASKETTFLTTSI